MNWHSRVGGCQICLDDRDAYWIAACAGMTICSISREQNKFLYFTQREVTTMPYISSIINNRLCSRIA